MPTQTGSIDFKSTKGFQSYASGQYATLTQVKGQFATCSTAAGTQAKAATIVPSDTGWELYTGATITVRFTADNTHATPTLNVNSTGAKSIRDHTGAALTEEAYKWKAGDALAFTYDGTYWRMQDTLAQRVTINKTAIEQTANNVLIKATQSDTTASQAGQHIIESLINVAPSGVKIAADKVEIDGTAVFKAANAIPDTRSNNQPPSWYFTNYPRQSVTEFKTSSVMGLTGETYCYVTTVTGWNDKSGGYPKQTAQIAGKTYWRVGVSDSAWGTWQETESTTGAQDKVDALDIGGRNLLPGTETLDGFVASVTNITFVDGVLTMPGNASGWDRAHTPIVPFSKVDGNNITVSFEYRADVTTHIYICTEGLAADTVDGARSKYKDHQYDLPAKSEWTKWSATFPNMSLAYLTQGSGDVNFFRLALYDRTNNSNLKVRFPKMEKGNKATDWSPAPEDQTEYADKLNSITTYSDTYKKFKNPAALSLSGSHTGALIITTPVLPNHMVTLKIDGYNYTGGNETIEMDISFYNYTTNFHQHGYVNYGTRVLTPVRFAKVSSSDKRAVVIIGDANTAWSYSKIAVREAMVSHDAVPDSYADGWTMSIATELPSSYIELTTCSNSSNFKLATSVSERIYYRSNSSTKPSAPTSWVADATQNVWNAWTTKVPPLAADKESGSVKYLYLWTCEQRKDVSGAFLGCTAVQLDENTTVIDGGTIITNSVTANQIAASTITGEEIAANTIDGNNIKGSTITAEHLSSAFSLDLGKVEGLKERLESVEQGVSGVQTNTQWVHFDQSVGTVFGESGSANNVTVKGGGIDFNTDEGRAAWATGGVFHANEMEAGTIDTQTITMGDWAIVQSGSSFYIDYIGS